MCDDFILLQENKKKRDPGGKMSLRALGGGRGRDLLLWWGGRGRSMESMRL